MRPVLFSLLGFDVQTYGLSKALAAWLGAVLLARAFEHRGMDRRYAFSLVLWGTDRASRVRRRITCSSTGRR